MIRRGPSLVACLFASAASALLGGCASEQPAVVGDLAFPVLVLFEDSGVVRHDDAADLRTMSTQRVVGSNSPPFLVDSRLDVYRLDRLASVHGGLWLMANPSGHTEVTFELVRIAQADVARAQALIAERDPRLRSGDEPEARRRLLEATTLAAMLAAVDR